MFSSIEILQNLCSNTPSRIGVNRKSLLHSRGMKWSYGLFLFRLSFYPNAVLLILGKIQTLPRCLSCGRHSE